MDQRNMKFCHLQTGYHILGQLNTVGATKQHSLFLSPFCSPCGWQHIYLLGFCGHKSFPSHIHFVRVQIPLQHPRVLLNTRDMSSTPDPTIIMIASRYCTHLNFAGFEMQMWPQLLCEAFWDTLMEIPWNSLPRCSLTCALHAQMAYDSVWPMSLSSCYATEVTVKTYLQLLYLLWVLPSVLLKCQGAPGFYSYSEEILVCQADFSDFTLVLKQNHFIVSNEF